ncbi:GNAT family N-acetyltransferase [Stenomitos frigidus]|uniref:GNAT family N-acetyltransferase n=1 Tax=Stenomitos frigidus ULC18 TaxID=2107698 RepID=A0A2T1DSU5_9CYAN|nr:GNAT family N-acetyltransferase [Stenomitos frigidus]PSB23586.1 GNAT family N-acetyltransferase [Stenomitos frigidus ULC18]
MQQDDVAIRLMQDDMQDYQLMAKWLTDEAVLEFYEGRDNPYPLARVLEAYRPKVLWQEDITPCLILYQTEAIGYLQYYPLTESDRQEYGDYDIGESITIYAVDLFIGESHDWNQGIGTKALSAALTYLFEHLQADKVLIDPHVSNARAIRCYEKCGFSKVKQLPAHELHEGKYRDCWLMVADRSHPAQ